MFKNSSDNNRKIASLIKDNSTAVRNYNITMLDKMLSIGGGLILLMVLLTPFVSDAKRGLWGYVLALVFFATLLILLKINKIHKNIRTWLYLGYTVALFLTIYVSVVGSPNERAAAFLGIMCLAPMTFIDIPIRMNIYFICIAVFHTVLAFIFKDRAIAMADTINCFCFTALGIYVGNAVVRMKLNGFEAQRQLVIEKTTDVLTGLSNRRRLFEQLGLIRQGKAEKPEGVMMIDIDYFKAFNDTNGHAAGDHCLSCFGELLQRYERERPVNFFRYGGEEFVGFIYGRGESYINALAQEIRSDIAEQSKDDGGITASFGTVWCSNRADLNYEHWIEKADIAVYTAKSRGRNSVVCFSNLDENAEIPGPEKRVYNEESISL